RTSAAAAPAFAFAGIAKPERFFGDLEKAGWPLAGRRTFRDHHQYSAGDLDEINRAARASGATVILTTSKDAVRIPSLPSLNIVEVRLELSIEPAFPFWLRQRLAD